MPAVTTRAATEADAGLLLEWRNDPVTRRWSRDTGEVGLDDHLAWLSRSLGSAERLLLIAESGGAAAGNVRFDLRAAGVWEVSITVAPEFRGRGLAGAILAAGEEALLRARPVDTVLAAVHRENAASAALFDRAGYVEREEPEGPFRRLSKTFVR
ncbi:GNAT family N-acetyltransferase [Amycolatopsis suaedae]|uniref:GNAT family N-acetyltransferase n=1 Tax=Amycolatopsis suaedae TaxID=2510978 RepID=A0A4Q7J4R9_9PSEU|nr:GNAT family N-acetyltransferase [Amycolatopsis suaedae]RZQ62027.1 GNAT family N-acetyltransferase [Amycolatopsis suaedae]